jgi:hypothetical protein
VSPILTQCSRIAEDSLGRRGIHGINETAAYFHDDRAKTLSEAVKHYQSFFFFINTVRGLPLPLIPDEDLAPIVAYMKRAF